MLTTTHDVRGRAAVRTTSRAVELRPLERGDHATLLEIFAGMSPRSRELRFLTPKPRLSQGELRRLTDVDHHDHIALVAVATSTGRPIGIGRFVREPGEPDSADVALAVVDAWQGRGVGTLIAKALGHRAREVGVRRFTLIAQRDNAAVLSLLRRSSGAVTRLNDDAESVELAVSLPG